MDATLLDSAVTQTRQVASWVADADPTTVPTCPGWTVTELAGHIGATQRWVGRPVAESITDPGTAFSLGWEQPPADPSAWPRWPGDGADLVRDTSTAATDGRQLFDPSGSDGVGNRDELVHLIANMNWIGDA